MRYLSRSMERMSGSFTLSSHSSISHTISCSRRCLCVSLCLIAEPRCVSTPWIGITRCMYGYSFMDPRTLSFISGRFLSSRSSNRISFFSPLSPSSSPLVISFLLPFLCIVSLRARRLYLLLLARLRFSFGALVQWARSHVIAFYLVFPHKMVLRCPSFYGCAVFHPRAFQH